MIDSSNIDKVINTFFEEEGFEVTATLGTDFAYWYADSYINYALVVSERMDNLFLAYAKELGLKVDCGIFLLSLFHELGHHETMDLLEDEDFYQGDKNSLDADSYFRLTEETEATQWAIDFINSNVEKVEKLAKDLQKEIAIFYKKYNIEG